MAKNPRDSARFFYKTACGRAMLKILASPSVSRICGRFLDSKASKGLAKRYIKKNHIVPEDYYGWPYRSFNSCFTRKIREEKRPIAEDPAALIAPCDGYLSAYKIDSGTVLPIKQSSYTLSSLLENSELADRYNDGTCLVFRLNVNNYHRYCYIDEGIKGGNTFIPGRLHSVRPVALEKYPVFVRNSREYTVMDTEHFGTVTQVEVGAMLVGKIKNYHGTYAPRRGEEKGLFEYGGSTIILLFEKGAVSLDESLFTDTVQHIERPVRLGEAIGEGKEE